MFCASSSHCLSHSHRNQGLNCVLRCSHLRDFAGSSGVWVFRSYPFARFQACSYRSLFVGTPKCHIIKMSKTRGDQPVVTKFASASKARCRPFDVGGGTAVSLLGSALNHEILKGFGCMSRLRNVPEKAQDCGREEGRNGEGASRIYRSPCR